MPSIGIFDRLGFPANMANNTIKFSDNTQNSLANLPPILTTWQMQDIANSNTGGYFVNPVDSYTNTINSTLVSIQTEAANCNLTTIVAVANSVITSNNVNQFWNHTNRISGVAPIDINDALLPQYNTCIGIGKALTYIIYQSDGISNNAVLMGNFGSLYSSNTLSQHSANLANDLILIKNSVSGGNSNLSVGQITSITNHINVANTYIYSTMMQDVNYYNNCRNVLNDYNSIKGMSHMGDTEKYLVNTLIGSDKLKQRLS